jgi:hypothetical protein
MAIFWRSLLNLIKANPLKGSVAGRMMRAGWNSKFRSKYCLVEDQTKYNPALLSTPFSRNSKCLTNVHDEKNQYPYKKFQLKKRPFLTSFGQIMLVQTGCKQFFLHSGLSFEMQFTFYVENDVCF